MTQICSVHGCHNPVLCRGICNKHYHVARQLEKRKACACGCGELTSYTYKWGHHTRLFTSEEQSRRGRHNDGSTQRDRGTGKSYRKVRGRHEHRDVAEQMLGRALLPGEIVHHLDGDKRNNTPGNLKVMTQSEHLNTHRPQMLAERKVTRGS